MYHQQVDPDQQQQQQQQQANNPNLRSNSMHHLRINPSSNNPNAKKQKFVCENDNCPLRGFEFHWCSSPGCPLTNHCHLSGDNCEIVEPGFMVDQQPNINRRGPSPVQNQQPAYMPNQPMQRHQSLAQQSQPSRNNSMSNQSYATLPRNPTPILSKQTQIYNYEPVAPKPEMASHRPSMASQSYAAMSQRPSLDEGAYPQYNDCIPIPIVVLKRVFNENENAARAAGNNNASRFGSNENLNSSNANNLANPNMHRRYSTFVTNEELQQHQDWVS
jgi:hypothetical protein